MNKYKNKIVYVDNIKFHSKKEANHYQKLKILEKYGKIKNLELQKKFVLIPKQPKNKGLRAERECAYYADFVYNINNSIIVEDVKGIKTNVYKLKRKLMKYIYGIDIHEI